MLDVQTSLLEKFTHCSEESVPKCTNLYNIHVLPNRECQPRDGH